MSRYSVVRQAIEPFRGSDQNWGRVQQVAGAVLVRDCLIGTGSLTGGRRTRTPFGSVFLIVWGSFFGGAATAVFGGEYGYDPRNLPTSDLWLLLFPLFGGLAVLAGAYGLLSRLVGVVLGGFMWWQGRRDSAVHTLTPRSMSASADEDVRRAREAVAGALFAHSRIVRPVAAAPRPTRRYGLGGVTTSWAQEQDQSSGSSGVGDAGRPASPSTPPVVVPPTIAPPGWYPAGEPGTVRYWDGSAWTAHRHPAPITGNSPSPATASVTSPGPDRSR